MSDTRRNLVTAGVVALVLFMALAVWNHHNRTQPDAHRSAATTSPSSAPSTPVPQPSTESSTSSPAATRDPVSRGQQSAATAGAEKTRELNASDQAMEFMITYARPPAKGSEHDLWWSSVLTFLTPQAQKQLHVDPAKVAFTRVTGQPKVQGTEPNKWTPSSRDVLVRVGTDHGAWVVRMTDAMDNPGWLVVSAAPEHRATPAKKPKATTKPTKKATKKATSKPRPSTSTHSRSAPTKHATHTAKHH